MNETVLVALIGAAGGVISAFIASQATSRKVAQEITQELKTQQAVTDTKIEELTREVREHNNFARRMPVVEEQIKVVNHRIEDLEHYHK